MNSHLLGGFSASSVCFAMFCNASWIGPIFSVDLVAFFTRSGALSFLLASIPRSMTTLGDLVVLLPRCLETGASFDAVNPLPPKDPKGA